jgi:hypothetical protein
MSNYREIYDNLTKSANERRRKQKHQTIELSAYLLAKKDNYQKSPEYYWLEAEKNY